MAHLTGAHFDHNPGRTSQANTLMKQGRTSQANTQKEVKSQRRNSQATTLSLIAHLTAEHPVHNPGRTSRENTPINQGRTSQANDQREMTESRRISQANAWQSKSKTHSKWKTKLQQAARRQP